MRFLKGNISERIQQRSLLNLLNCFEEKELVIERNPELFSVAIIIAKDRP